MSNMQTKSKPVIFCCLVIVFTVLTFASKAQNYFQQEVNYSIDVLLDDENHYLRGYETIEYINNSPYELFFLYFHIYPNGYKNRNTALARQKVENGDPKLYYADKEDLGIIDSLNFRINEEKIEWEYDTICRDICKLYLNKSLKGGDTVYITTPFRVKIPKAGFSRLGHAGQSYQISQWYPKPAVYDSHGWHPMPYLDMGEFYSEFGKFDVQITLPKNYVVAATGNLQNADELQWLDALSKKNYDNVIKHKLPDNSAPPSDASLKTLRYTEKNIHDFAWFADKRYRVLKSNVVLPQSQHNVTTWAFFTPEVASQWQSATTFINDAVTYYSKWYGDYPYNNCTAVYGPMAAGGGMEYPTITVISGVFNSIMLEDVIMHEVGHNWMYGILGFNERRYPFLDEGINSFTEMRYLYTKYPQLKLYQTTVPLGLAKLVGIENLPQSDMYRLSYLMSARSNSDQPSELHSIKFTYMNYGSIVYHKTACSFNYLKSYLGDALFDSTMHIFYERWKFKHPYPDDLQKVFEEVTNKNLSWFFNDVIKTTKRVDYKLVRSRDNRVLVRNTGQTLSPVPISGIKDNAVSFTKWYEGFEGEQWLELPDIDSNNDKLAIIPTNLQLDFRTKNNLLRTKGILRKTEPLSIKLLTGVEQYNRNFLYVAPAIARNYYNGYMLGAVLNNGFLPEKRIDYMLVPMFALNNQQLAGLGKITMHINPYEKAIKKINFTLAGRQFGYDKTLNDTTDVENYQRLKLETEFIFRNPNPRSRIEHKASVASVWFSDIYTIGDNPPMQWGYKLNYLFQNYRILNPFSLSLNYQAGKDYAKIWTDCSYTLSYSKKGKGLTFRLFAGNYFYNDDFLPGNAITLGGTTGSFDYMFDYTYLGRFEQLHQVDNMAAHQFIKDQGGFTLYNPISVRNGWLASLNISASIPKLPVRLYANIGTYDGAGEIFIDNANKHIKTERLAWESGAELVIIPSVCSIYMPLFSSSDLTDYFDSMGGKFSYRIRFTLELYKITPSKLINGNF